MRSRRIPRYYFSLALLLSLSSLAAGCAAGLSELPACATPPAAMSPSLAAAKRPQVPTSIEIGRRLVAVDQIVEGDLCDGAWRGAVYVTCNVRVRPWIDQPDFLKGCRLTIEPGTTVYVAAHHNAAYYNGCSCHTGEAP